MDKILQLVKADEGWRAALMEGSSLVERTVVSWALCEKSKKRTVEGIILHEGKMVPASECPTLVGYLAPGMSVNELVRPGR